MSEIARKVVWRYDDPMGQRVGVGFVEEFDPAKPNIARVWDYWLGGKENFAADRQLARKMLEIYPLSAQMAQENRQFLGRAVAYVAGRGIRQFIDVGAGLPTAVNTHDIARRAAPGAKVAYVDNDPVVVMHARALLAGAPGVVAMPGDMRDPLAIVTDPELNRLISMAEPVCVVLSGVLHFLEVDAAQEVAAGFARVIAPGSYVIISAGTGKNNAWTTDYQAAYTAAPLYFHSSTQIMGFFDGLDLVPPGLVPARGWVRDAPAPQLKSRQGTFLAGVGRKTG